MGRIPDLSAYSVTPCQDTSHDCTFESASLDGRARWPVCAFRCRNRNRYPASGDVRRADLIWVGFHLYGVFVNGNGAFLTARNLWNLSVQTCSIAIMATGMVLIIVTRNIDLSVGSVLGVVGMCMGVLQVEWLPPMMGLGNPAIWIITVVFACCWAR